MKQIEFNYAKAIKLVFHALPFVHDIIDREDDKDVICSNRVIRDLELRDLEVADFRFSVDMINLLSN